MAAAARRDVGDIPGADALKQLDELGRLAVDPGAATFTVVFDSSTMNITAPTAGIKVERQHAAGTRGGIVNRHRGRLGWRVGGEWPGVAGRVGAAAVTRDPDMRRTGDRGRDRMPGGLCSGAREAVRTARARCSDTRRVAHWQC